LPIVDPIGGNYWLSTAEAKALGLLPADSSADGFVGFSSTAPLAYDPNNRAVPGEFDFIGIVAHKISEVLGSRCGPIRREQFYPVKRRPWWNLCYGSASHRVEPGFGHECGVNNSRRIDFAVMPPLYDARGFDVWRHHSFHA
jgi:hypothetical protein